MKWRDRRSTGWHRWFAWRPVYSTQDRCWYWLEIVSRCYDKESRLWVRQD